MIESVRGSIMTLSEAAVLLRGTSSRLLEGLSSDERSSLSETATIRKFQPGSPITQEGFPADTLILLVQGLARFSCTTIDGGNVLLRRIHPGEICGVAALLSEPVEYLLTAEAIKPCVAVVWRRAPLRAFAAKCPRLLDNGMLVAYDYARWYRTAHVGCRSDRASPPRSCAWRPGQRYRTKG